MHIKNSTLVLVVILLIVGMFFRLYDFSSYIFGFDQIQILTNAEHIKSGNLTLLGPRTGPAEMFTGPVIYYLAAILLLVVPNPWVLVATSGVIAFFTGLTLFWLGKRHISQMTGLALLGIWSLSPLLIFFDRVTWNPNLTLLASSLVFFPLLTILRGKKLTSLDYGAVFSGVFLGFQAHFSGLLLFPFLVLFQMLWRKFDLKSSAAGLLGLIFTLTPTLIFDIRNNWLNVRGLLSFLANRDEVHNSFQLFRFTSGMETNLKNVGGIFTYRSDATISLFIGFVLLFCAGYVLWKQRSNKDTTQKIILSVSLVWSLLVTVALSFYSSNAPEYYFFISLPAVLLLITTHIPQHLDTKKISFGLLAVLLFGCMYVTMNLKRIVSDSTYTIGAQLTLAQDLAKKSITQPIQNSTYDMRPVDALGVAYFIDKLVPVSPTGSLVHVVNTAQVTKRYKHLGAWFDPRTDASRVYLTQDDLIISTPTGVGLLQNFYEGPTFGSNRVFSLATNTTISLGLLVIIDRVSDPLDTNNQTVKDFFASIKPLLTTPYWATANYKGVEGFVQEHEHFALFYVPETFDENTIPEELSFFSVYPITPQNF